MPRVKVDYIVSFSSEDPENPANNLLATEVSKKRWLCTKGTPTCSVVLQLARSTKISTLQIGSHHASLVEVLVGRSEIPDQPYKVLVPVSVFITPSVARNSEGVERVRSFDYHQLATDARDSSWDRVRVVCSQPYNKHCKYGLSFIHIFEPEGENEPLSQSTTASVPASIPPRLLELDTKSSDEEDNFRPGELFAKYRSSGDESSQLSQTLNLSTDALIRNATAKALKNIPEPLTKVVKSPLVKDRTRNSKTTENSNEMGRDRDRNELLYTTDDEVPNKRIDKLIEQHKNEKAKEKAPKDSSSNKNKTDQQNHDNSRINRTSVMLRHSEDTRTTSSTQDQSKGKKNYDVILNKTPKDSKKRALPVEKPSSSNRLKKAKTSQACSPHRLLEDVVFVISGYENPRRSNLRSAALAMGARYERDWAPRCTHLICAFSNTPKLKTVRSTPDGDRAIVVTGEWIEECCSKQRRLPWQWFATESKYRTPKNDLESEDEHDSPEPDAPDSEMDTDDEIEKVLQEQQQQKQQTDKSPKFEDKVADPPIRADYSNDSDVTFVTDERMKGQVILSDSDSDDTVEGANHLTTSECITSLPTLFDGKTFVIDESAGEAGFEPTLLKRYIKAYGGELLEVSLLDEHTQVNYVLSGPTTTTTKVKDAIVVRADWLWRCHQDQQLVSISPYLLHTNDEGD